jgi:hypothetical protein
MIYVVSNVYIGNGVENVIDILPRAIYGIYSNLQHPTASYGILRQSTAFYGIYGILRHPTAFYGTLRHFTAPYGILRQPTAFYGMSTAFYGILRHVYGILRHTRLRHLRGFFETFVSIWLLLTFIIMMDNIEDWLAQVHGILQGNADGSLVCGNAMPEQSTNGGGDGGGDGDGNSFGQWRIGFWAAIKLC